MGNKNKRTEAAYKKAIEALKNLNEYIKEYPSKCGVESSWMHIPFKDESQNDSGDYPYALDSENWNISNKEKKQVLGWMADCYKYADIMAETYGDESTPPLEYMIVPTHLFPWYNRGSIAWRMGPGESYGMWWYEHKVGLSEEDKKWLKETYPKPISYRRYEDSFLESIEDPVMREFEEEASFF